MPPPPAPAAPPAAVEGVGDAGIAVVGAIFFNRLAVNGGSWSLAFRTALWVTIAFVTVALAAAVADVLAARREPSEPSPEPESAPAR